MDEVVADAEILSVLPEEGIESWLRCLMLFLPERHIASRNRLFASALISKLSAVSYVVTHGNVVFVNETWQ
jgi:hypothetical protein